MLGTRSQFEGKKEDLSDTELRIRIESLRYLRKNEPDKFKEAREKLKDTDLWQRFQREYG